MKKTAITLIFVFLGLGATSFAEQLAFPGAEGYGAYATGGRGGDVYHVTTLADYNSVEPNIAGSLRWGLESATGPRTIVFDISGNILLQGVLDFNKSYLTVAGQTAPAGGITLAQRQIQVGSGQYSTPPSTPTSPIDTNNVIIRYIRCRLTPNAAPRGTLYPEEEDALRVISCQDTILDHVSTSWGRDEVMSITGRSNNVTIQWGIYAEVLDNHPKASLFRPWVDSNITGHHNLYVSNQARTPRFGNYNGVTTRFDWYNNVNYNWGYQNAYSNNNTYCHDDFGPWACGTPGEHVQINYIKNYLIAGPQTTGPELVAGPPYDDYSIYNVETYPNLTELWVNGNVMDGNKNGGFDGTADAAGDFSRVKVNTALYNEATAVFPITAPNDIELANSALQRVLAKAGASLYRDEVDSRLTMHVEDGNGTNVVIDETTVGGLPSIPSVSRPAGFDTDGDGMPNLWEIPRGLDANDANDGNDDKDGDGFTNLEEYLNYLAIIYSSTLGDYDGDDGLDYDDFFFFIDDWLVNDPCYIPAGDLYASDNFVDWRDFAIFAGIWSGIYIPDTAYYVATTGNDSNPGTAAQPWRTIQKAADTLVVDEKVIVRPGTYNEQVTPLNSGSSINPITYQADPLGDVIIDANGHDYGFYVNGKSWIVIDGFKVTGASSDGIHIFGTENLYTVVRNCDSYGNSDDGIEVRAADRVTVEDCLAYNNTDKGINAARTTDNFEAKNCIAYGNDIGLSLTGGYTVYDCTVYGNDIGFDFVSGTSNVYDCIVTDNTTYGFQGNASHTADYCDAYNNGINYSGVIEGSNCISADPLFIDPPNDFHLDVGSPCIGTASDGGDMGYQYPP